jgi:peroxiredoxin
MERVIKVGDRLPSFALPNAYGQEVRSADLLVKGPLVLTFFRGAW